MTDKIARLESLTNLAMEPSSEKRQELLREITDVFLDEPEGLGESEVEGFGDIMGKVAFELEMEVRQHLAEQLSTVGTAPHGLITMLANDAIEVARPVLMNSPVLKSADLAAVAKQLSQEHLQAISNREHVDSEVSDALISRGNDAVLVSLAQNDGAVMSRWGMETMVERSAKLEALQKPMVTRKDLPQDLVQEMFWQVSSALRQHILTALPDVDEGQVDEWLGETEAWFEAANPGAAATLAEQFVLKKQHAGELNTTLIAQLLRRGQIAELVAAVSCLARLDLGATRRIIFDEGGEALAVVCKAIDLDRSTFADMTLLTASGEKAKVNANRPALLSVYGRMTIEAAQRALRFWRVRLQMQDKKRGRRR
jgi:uncharacterized protein (DUF2336 family)